MACQLSGDELADISAGVNDENRNECQKRFGEPCGAEEALLIEPGTIIMSFFCLYKSTCRQICGHAADLAQIQVQQAVGMKLEQMVRED